MAAVAVIKDGIGLVPTDESGRHAVAHRFTMYGRDGFRVQLSSYGARVTSIVVPDKDGIPEEVLLGFDVVQDYLAQRDYFFGSVLGRVAGRLINAECMCLEQLLLLIPNIGIDHYNGGFKGFDNVVWESSIEGDNEVVFSLLSEAQEEGYPSSVLAQVAYQLVNGCELRVRMGATCTSPTPIAMAHRLPFNLAGHGSGKKGMLEHTIAINGAKYLVMDDNDYPTGEERLVDGTPLDFRTRRLLKKWHPVVPRGGLNHTFVYTGGMEHGPHFVARLHHPPSGRTMEVRSDLPCVYVDTMRWLPPKPRPFTINVLSDLMKRDKDEMDNPPEEAGGRGPAGDAWGTPSSPGSGRSVPSAQITVVKATSPFPFPAPERFALPVPQRKEPGEGAGSPPLPKFVFPAPREYVAGGKGAAYWRHGGILLQSQHFPDTLDHRHLPGYLLKPGELYVKNVWYRFFSKPPRESEMFDFGYNFEEHGEYDYYYPYDEGQFYEYGENDQFGQYETPGGNVQDEEEEEQNIN